MTSCRARTSFRSFKNFKKHRTDTFGCFTTTVSVANKFSYRKLILPVWNKHLKPKNLIMTCTEESVLIHGDHPPSLARTTSIIFNMICLLDRQRVQKADILDANVCLHCTSKCSRDLKEDDTFQFSFVNYTTSLTGYQNYSGVQYSCQIQRRESIMQSSIFKTSTTSSHSCSKLLDSWLHFASNYLQIP